jgi:histidinol-phosphate aminotransferase
MVDLKSLVRENVRKLIPYKSARDEFSGKTGIFLDANENPYGNLNRYPDPYQRELKTAISKIKGIEQERIFLGNGSDEIIDLCFRIFCNPGRDKALIFTPTYGMYEVSASVNDIETIKIPLNKNFQIDLVKTKLVLPDGNLKLIFICSPNNPTANAMNSDDVEDIITNFNGIVVIDEAYIDFSEKPSFLNLINTYPNLILMHTFSKAFGLAAARVGMAFSSPEIIRFFNKMKPPYNISTINQKAALNKLNNMEGVKNQVLRIRRERDKLSLILQKMKVVETVYPSDANFLLVKVKNANYIYNTLINNNIITRNRSSVVDNCLRITVGKRSENDILIDAFYKLDHLTLGSQQKEAHLNDF